MLINFRKHNFECNDSLETFMREKVGSLEKYMASIKDAYVELSGDTHHKKGNVARCEITLHLIGDSALIRAEETVSDMHEAIDLVVGKLKILIQEHKEKKRTIDRKALRSLKEM